MVVTVQPGLLVEAYFWYWLSVEAEVTINMGHSGVFHYQFLSFGHSFFR